jgi:hypothetical protein
MLVVPLAGCLALKDFNNSFFACVTLMLKIICIYLILMKTVRITSDIVFRLITSVFNGFETFVPIDAC